MKKSKNFYKIYYHKIWIATDFSGVLQKVNHGVKAINMTAKFSVFQNQKLQCVWKV